MKPTEITHNWMAIAVYAALCVAVIGAGCRSYDTPEVTEPLAPEETEQMQQMEPQEEAADVDWELTSTAFENGEDIPARHTCSADDLSPKLEWTDPPADAVEVALIVDDPDAPGGTFVHWVIYGIEPDISELPEGMPAGEELTSPVQCRQGRNDFDVMGYRGPCPPGGEEHRYYFKLYALDEALSLQPGVNKAELVNAMEGKIIAEAELMGTYER